MPAPPSPSPRLDRRVYVLLLDDQHRLMLCRACCSGWTVPQAPLDSDADFRESATRFLAERFQIHEPRYGSLFGIHTTRAGECWQHDQPTISHVFLIRISAEESDAIQQLSAAHARWGVEELKSRHRDISPEGVVLMAAGYVAGWLPDGPISLS